MKKFLAGIFVFFSLFISVYAQEQSEINEEAQTQTQTENAAKEYKIQNIKYDSKGITKDFALKRNVNVDYSKTFKTEEELKTYIDYLVQQLDNTRLLDDISYSYEILEEAEGFIPVEITIQVSDSSHFLIFPKPSYNSNTGFNIELAVKDTNFLGFMNTLNFDVNMDYNTNTTSDEKITLGTNFNYNYPFSIGITDDTWTNKFSLNWTIGKSSPDLSYSTGIETAIPFGRNFLRTNFTQSLTLKDSYKDYGDSFYFTEYFGLSLPLTIGRINDMIPVNYTPSFDITYNWDADGINTSNGGLLGPSMAIRQTINVSTVNWKNNFREGYAFELYHYFSYNFYSRNFSPFLALSFSAFKAFKYAGINFRAYGYGVINDSQNNIGGRLRGIVDGQNYGDASLGQAMSTTLAMAFNLDIPIHIITTDWMGWGEALFGSYNDFSPAMQKLFWLPHKVFPYLDFELQISPFVDIGLTKNKATGRSLNPKDSFIDAGFEVLVYPTRFRSYVVRGSFGVDVGRKLFSSFLNTDWRDMNVKAYEISIGLGLHF
ncbi:MAG: hypothetical protein J6Y60_01290 [Treponema sp.]|nr:hypothetical protein [Treponema sp.]